MKCPVNYVSFVRGFKNTGSNKHYGIDLGWFSNDHHNQPIMSCDDGIVVYSKYQVTGGYTVQIKHDNGLISEYGHMLKGSICVKVGQKVAKGQQIGKMGKTGTVTAEHCHFAILKATKSCFTKSLYVDPAKYINVYSNQVENDKTKGKFIHTKKVKGTDGELNVRKNALNGKIVYKVKEGSDIETYGTRRNANIVDNVRNYVCYATYTK